MWKNKFLLLLVALCCPLCACSQSASDKTPLPFGSSSEASGRSDGTPLFEMYKDADIQAFAQNFDPENVQSVSYYHDEAPTIETTDKEMIRELFEALSAVTVTGKYKSDTFATDSMERYTFTLKDGSEIVIIFDFGKLSIGRQLYDCTDKKALTSALIKMRPDNYN